MKKHYSILSALLLMTSGLCALTDAEAKKKGDTILETMVTAHTLAFGVDNLYKTALNLSLWNVAISEMKNFVTTILNENKNFIGMKDSTLTKAFEKVTKAELDLVNTIKTTRGLLASPQDLSKQIALLNQIKNDMLAVQKSLQSNTSSSMAKKEAQKILNSSAMFIETTAAKAARDAQK